MVAKLPLTIVTICFNSEKTIQKTLASVLSQDAQPAEHIFIDGGSLDATLQILNEYQKRAPFPVRIISETDSGISDAFNKGIVLSSQEWTHLLNSDDSYLNESALQLFDKIRKDSDKSIIGFGAYFEQDDGSKVYKTPCRRNGSLKSGMTYIHPGCFVRSEMYKIVGGFNLSFKTAMDYEWLLRAESRSGSQLFEEHFEPIVLIGFGGESIQNRSRSYREVLAAQLLHSRGSIFAQLIFYFLRQFFFCNSLGSVIWQAIRKVRNLNRSQSSVSTQTL